MQKKLFLLLVFLCCCSLGTFGQTGAARKAPYYNPEFLKPVDNQALIQARLDLILNEPKIQVDPARLAEWEKEKQLPRTLRTSSLEVDADGWGRSSNAFTIINERANQLLAIDGRTDNEDIIMWLHRQDIEVFGGSPATTANGVFRANMLLGKEVQSHCSPANTWLRNIGPFNPIPYKHAARARYPQGVLHIPANDSANFNNAVLAWVTPCTDGNSWGNYGLGTAWDLCNFGAQQQDENWKGIINQSNDATNSSRRNFDFLSNNQNNRVFIPGGMCEGRPGEFWFFDHAFLPGAGAGGNGIYLDSLLLWKGTLNSDKKVEWKKHQVFRPDFFRDNDGARYVAGGTTMAFSPNGQFGWAYLAADLVEAPGQDTSYEATPIFWSTRDFGQTWQGPHVVRLSDYKVVTDSITRIFRPSETDTARRDTSTGIPFILGGGDIVVDKNGNPHVFMNVANQSSATPHPDSLRYFQAFMYTYDLTTHDFGKTWSPKPIWLQRKYRGAAGLTSTFNCDPFLQVSRDKTGEFITYSWVDDTINAANEGGTEMRPDLFERAYRVSDGAFTPVTNLSMDDNTYRGKIFFPAVPPTVLTKSDGRLHIPTVFAEMDGVQSESQVTFAYLKNRFIDTKTFVKPEQDVELTILGPDTNLCFVPNAKIRFRLTNRGTQPTNDSIEVYYSINNGTSEMQQFVLPAPLAVGESAELVFTKAAEIERNGTYAIRVWSNAQNDYVTTNHIQERLVRNFGGVNKALFETSTVQGCGQVAINSGLGGLRTSWSINGTPVTSDSSVLVINESTTGLIDGRGSVILRVTSTAGCTPSTLVDTIQVTIYPDPIIAARDTQICAASAPFNISINPNTTSADFEYGWATPLGVTLPDTNANSVSLNSMATGNYTVRLKNKTTGCEVRKTLEVIIWNLDLKVREDFYRTQWAGAACNSSLIDVAEKNPTVSRGTQFKWFYKLGPAPEIDMQNNTSGQTTIIDSNAFKSGGVTPDYQTIYRVEARDPLGCNKDNPAVASFAITTYSQLSRNSARPQDSMFVILDSKPYRLMKNDSIVFPKVRDHLLTSDPGAPVAIGCPINLVDTSRAGITPITHRYWSITPVGGFSYVKSTTSGSLGSLTSGTKDVIVNFTAPRDVKRTCSLTITTGPFPRPIDRRPAALRLVRCIQTETVFLDVNRRYICSAPESRNEMKRMDANLRIYPNPFNNSFNINYELPMVEAAQIEVIDITGKVVHREAVQRTQEVNQKVDLSNLPAGMYVLKLESDSVISTQKLLKQ
jgi:hypothetical protein